LLLRSPSDSDHVFLYHYQPLSVSYCYARLRTYGEQSGIAITPHQLRHTCATLVHARVYDRTVEQRLTLADVPPREHTPGTGSGAGRNLRTRSALAGSVSKP